jgi:response regulator RpfG family c-di-GMP phosphodiesterase
MVHLLYIEDDEIDVLALKRTLRGFKEVQLTVAHSLASLQELDFSVYDLVLSDVNLPDGSKNEISTVIPEKLPMFWVSGNADKDVLAKPISPERLEEVLKQVKVVDLAYIKSLADGDEEYEQEMIETALDLLPQRLKAIITATNTEEIQQAAHKAKSSFRVCGIQSKELEILDSPQLLNLSEEQVLHYIEAVKAKINTAIEELSALLD